jgi:XRE family aerobic/anaerobic benzoate catabolism transcriptional regulator
MRPMAASREAMEDLKGILAGRAAFYSKAEFRSTPAPQPLEPTFRAAPDRAAGPAMPA